MTVSRFPDAPPAIAALPVDRRGYPVPWFVSWIDGEPEFRAVEAGKVMEADRAGLCWVCGRPFGLGALRTFVIGPMCAVNRISAEPPVHLTCGRFAVQACPFLTRPMAKRRPYEGEHAAPPGMMIERNPGVSLLWVNRDYRRLREGSGLLFRLGTPAALEWWSQGREATREEVMESITTGLPLLRAQAQKDGPEALELLVKMTGRALKLVPAQ